MSSKKWHQYEFSRLEIRKGGFVEFYGQFGHSVLRSSSEYSSYLIPDPSLIQYIHSEVHLEGAPIFNKFFSRSNMESSFSPRTYGRWWDEGPSRFEDFMPQNNGSTISRDFIDVQFETEVYPIHVSIFEGSNPLGSVVKIWAKDTGTKWQQLWSGPTQHLADKPRVFSPPLQFCGFKTKTLRLELNCTHLDFYTELCSILLLGTAKLLVPGLRYSSSTVSALLLELGLTENSAEDPCNLTPDISSEASLINHLTLVKDALRQNCRLHSQCGVERRNSSKLPIISTSCDKGKQTVKRSDDFDELPDEIMLRVLKSLDLRSLVRCSQVNKRFNRITHDPRLYTSLNLKAYWNCIDAAALRFLTPRCTYLRRLDLSWTGHYGLLVAKDVINFLKSCGRLMTHLRLNCCEFDVNEVFPQISLTCKNLKELCLSKCRTVTPDSKLPSLQHLERLELSYTRLTEAQLCRVLKQNNKMRLLKIGLYPDMIGPGLDADCVANVLARFCPHIESIDLWMTMELTEIGVAALARCCRLREIDLGLCHELCRNDWTTSMSDSLWTLLASCSSLEKVSLTGVQLMRSRHIDCLVMCKELRQLNLGRPAGLELSEKIDMCSRILSGCHKLRLLDISELGIPDAQLEEWRKLYPNVTITSKFFIPL